MHASFSISLRFAARDSSIAFFLLSDSGLSRHSLNYPASRPHRATAGATTNDLPVGLRLCWSTFDLLSLGVAFSKIIARRHRLLLRHLLAFIVIADVIAGAAGDLRALIAVGLEAEIA